MDPAIAPGKVSRCEACKGSGRSRGPGGGPCRFCKGQGYHLAEGEVDPALLQFRALQQIFARLRRVYQFRQWPADGNLLVIGVMSIAAKKIGAGGQRFAIPAEEARPFGAGWGRLILLGLPTADQVIEHLELGPYVADD